MLNKERFFAYGQDRAGIEIVMRFHSVKRWHMIDTTRVQTLAEHSANVALLVYLLAVRCPEMYFGPAAELAGNALLHDVPETITGDMPSIAKGFMREHVGQGGMTIEGLEDLVTPVEFRPRISPQGKRLIKLCDLSDGIRFIRLHGVDITARHAREGLEDQLQDLKARAKADWPEIVYKHVADGINFYAYEHS